MYLLVCRAPSVEAADREAAEDTSFLGVSIDWDTTAVEWSTGAICEETGARDVTASAETREELEPYLLAAQAAGWAATLDRAMIAAYGSWHVVARPVEGTLTCYDAAGSLGLPRAAVLRGLIAALQEGGAL